MFNDINFYHHISYWGIFIWFLFLDQLTPIPEEVTLLSIGYIAERNLINPYFAGLAAIVGLTIIDNVFYWLAFSGNTIVEKLKNKISKKTQDKYIKGLQGHPVRTLLILSFIPKIRFFSPVFAGAFRVKWKLFFLVNGLGTIVFVILYIAAGMLFHNSLQYLLKELNIIMHSVFILFMIIITVVVFFRFRSKEKGEDEISD